MATGSTSDYSFPYPVSSDPVDVAGDIEDLAQALDGFLSTPAFIGDIAVNGGDITTSSATASLFNSSALTVNIGGAAGTVNVGASAGQVNIRGNLSLGNTKAYEINDVVVLSASALGTSVVSSSLTSFGTSPTITTPVVSGVLKNSGSAPTIASASVISPTTSILFVSGTSVISTIDSPFGSGNGGSITIIPTGAFTTSTSGNIAIASTAVVSRALIMTYDPTTLKWYPSY